MLWLDVKRTTICGVASRACTTINCSRKKVVVLSVSCLLELLDVLLKAPQNRLPAGTLEVFRVLCFCFKGFGDKDAFWGIQEDDFNRTAIAHGRRDTLMRDDSSVCSTEVKRSATVFRSHRVVEFAANTEVVRTGRRVPVIRSMIPVFDVVRRDPTSPDLLERSLHSSLNGDEIRHTKLRGALPQACVLRALLPQEGDIQ